MLLSSALSRVDRNIAGQSLNQRVDLLLPFAQRLAWIALECFRSRNNSATLDQFGACSGDDAAFATAVPDLERCLLAQHGGAIGNRQSSPQSQLKLWLAVGTVATIEDLGGARYVEGPLDSSG